MRTYLIPAVAAAALAGAAVAAQPSDAPTKAEVKFAKTIAGLTPGKPVTCIDTRLSRPTLSAAGNKLIYKVSRKLVYVSETRGGCENVANGDALVTRQYSSRLCSGDIAQTVDLVSRFPSGSCAIGPFTPYTAK